MISDVLRISYGGAGFNFRDDGDWDPEDTMFLNTLSAKSLSGTDESITQLNSCRLLTVSNLKTQCF